jgi:beta-N-acetylhexosaminidase
MTCRPGRMRRAFPAIVADMALAARSPTASSARPPATPAHPARPGGPGLDGRAAALASSMSVAEKVGQLLVLTVPGHTAADGGAALVRDYHIGGVIYFGGNLASARQVAALSAGLQDAARRQPPAIPLLIGTDQEGGIVSRLAGITTVFPGQMAAGATRDPALVAAQDRATGAQLRALGLNLDYAPVADVNVDPANPVIGIRSFGASPALVARLTSAAVEGFHQAGVAAVAKHFPGHGDTGTDSHTGLPVIHHTLAQWRRIDAPPFQAAIKAGADEIMIGHIEVPALDDSGQPASLSRRIVTGLLRGQLGYQGVVTTDSMQMRGAAIGHTPAQAAVAAIAAGCDQLLMPGSPATAYHALLRGVATGRIGMGQLDASVTRIIRLKLAWGLLDPGRAAGSVPPGPVNTPAERNLARQLAFRSVTVVRNRRITGSASTAARRVLPLRPGSRVHLAGPAAAGLAGPLRRDLAAAGGQLVASPDAADVIVVATQDAVTDQAQQRLVASFRAAARPVVILATGLPYDLGRFGWAAAGLASYGGAVPSLAAAAAVLTGRYDPAGRLPVTIPAAAGGAALRYGTSLRY